MVGSTVLIIVLVVQVAGSGLVIVILVLCIMDFMRMQELTFLLLFFQSLNECFDFSNARLGRA